MYNFKKHNTSQIHNCVLNHKNLLFYLKKSNKCTISLCLESVQEWHIFCGSDSVFFGAAPAPVPGFFSQPAPAPAPRPCFEPLHNYSVDYLPILFTISFS